MAGLMTAMQQPQAAPQQPAGGGMPPQAGQMPSQEQTPSEGQVGLENDAVPPEEQEQYERIVVNGMRLIYDPKTIGGNLTILAGEGDPIEGLAKAAVSIWERLYSSMEENGFKASGPAMMAAGKEIIEELADLSTNAGIHDFTQDPDGLEAGYFRALDDFRVSMQATGRLNKQAAAHDIDLLQKMDQSGQLEAVLMKLAERDQQSAGPQKPDQPPRGGLGMAMEA